LTQIQSAHKTENITSCVVEENMVQGMMGLVDENMVRLLLNEHGETLYKGMISLPTLLPPFLIIRFFLLLILVPLLFLI